MNSISIEELLNKLTKEPLNIIDIRNHQDYLYGKIPTAKNIDKFLLLKSPELYLEKNKTYYIYCQSGNSSSNLVNALNRLGYNTVNIAGGYNNYLLRR